MKFGLKQICLFGMGIALYVVFGTILNLPLIGHIQTDLGYIVFGVYCILFGWIGCIVGIIGCMIESLLVSGWFPIGWMIGQLAIGLICGITYKKTAKLDITKRCIINVIVTVVAVFVGIGLLKTLVECSLYTIPFMVKFVKDCIATVADVIPMILGMFIGIRLEKIFNKTNMKGVVQL